MGRGKHFTDNHEISDRVRVLRERGWTWAAIAEKIQREYDFPNLPAQTSLLIAAKKSRERKEAGA